MSIYLKYLTLAVSFCVFILSSTQFSFACIDCPANVCKGKMKPFGAQTKQGAKWNYDYYDYILIARPLWTRYDLSQNATDNNLKQKDAYKVARPFSVIEVIKSNKRQEGSDILYMKQTDLFTTHKIVQKRDDGSTYELDVCYNRVQHKKVKEISYLVFAKDNPDGSEPIIVCMTVIPSDALLEKKLEEADVVFSGFIKERGRKANSEYLDTFKVNKIYKNSYFQQTDEIAISHDSWVPDHLWKAMWHNPKQQVIVYASKNIKKEGYFNVVVTEDIPFEIELLRKERDRKWFW